MLRQSDPCPVVPAVRTSVQALEADSLVSTVCSDFSSSVSFDKESCLSEFVSFSKKMGSNIDKGVVGI